MYSYIAFGLRIHSALPLPELMVASEGPADLVIRPGRVDPPVVKEADTDRCFRLSSEEAVLSWDTVGSFQVRGGTEILVEALPGVEERLLRLPLLGMVMSVALHQRGILSLHASAVAIEGQGVAFVGRSGRGKSTLAAALAARGHALAADDLVALDLNPVTGPHILPGFPQVKLLPEAAVSLGEDPETLPLLASGISKRARRLEAGFSTQPLPLQRIYLLRSGGEMEASPLRPQEAVPQLASHSYVPVSFRRSLTTSDVAAHFRQCVELASRMPVYWLTRAPEPTLLGEVARRVEEEVMKAAEARGCRAA
jgi:hypothetical protein